MSTTFEVIPAAAPPRASDLLRAAEAHIDAFLASVAIPFGVTLRAELIEGESRRPFGDAPFVWASGKGTYLWISTLGIPGGTDVYCAPISSRRSYDDWHPLDAFREPEN